MARVQYRVVWRREGWVSERARVFGSFEAVDRHLARLTSRVDRDGRRLGVVAWRVESRPVGVWEVLPGMVHGLERSPAAGRSGVEPVLELEPYDAVAECRVAVLVVLASGGQLSLNVLRQRVGVRLDTVRAAVDLLVEEGAVVCEPGPRRARLCRRVDVDAA